MILFRNEHVKFRLSLFFRGLKGHNYGRQMLYVLNVISYKLAGKRQLYFLIIIYIYRFDRR